MTHQRHHCKVYNKNNNYWILAYIVIDDIFDFSQQLHDYYLLKKKINNRPGLNNQIMFWSGIVVFK